MFGFPLLVMAIAHTLVLDRLFTFATPADKMLYAGIAGICAVQVVVVGFLFYAFNDVDDDEATAASDEKKGQ